MSTKENKSAESTHNVGEILSKSEKLMEKYQKPLLVGIGAVILLVVGILGVRHYYLIPKEREAEVAIFKGETYFSAGQWDLALNGDGKEYIGLEEIISQYGSTKTGELASAYAGICYFHKGETEKALESLKEFSADDEIIAPAITGLVGDCYVDLGKIEEGINYFEKAADRADNDLLSPIYLKKAGIAYEELKKYDEAIKVYTKIKDNHPNSTEGADIEKYIERAKELAK